ncbi:MAG: glycogen synthase, partial [Candidatus Hodarchaeales archaeon]
MRVLYIAAECKPFSKTGGVGDVAGELPVALKEQGIDIEIATPLYGKINPQSVGEKTDNYTVRFGTKDESVEIYSGDLKGIPVNFLKNETYFEGIHNGKNYSEIYVHSDPVPFGDDALRFSFFSEACLELIRKRKPDIVHVNDWLLGYLFGRMVMEGMTQKRVLTVHNIGYQGNFWKVALNGWHIEKILNDDVVGPLFLDPHLEWDSINPLRLGFELSDMANTVSPTYCKEMLSLEDQGRYFEGGKGLHEITRKLYNKGQLIGILNGFQYGFTPNDNKFDEILQEKRAMKKALSLDFTEPENFLLGFVGRAVEQKFKLLQETVDGKSVLDHLLNIPGVNVAILATGQPEYETFIKSISIGRNNYSYAIAFDRARAKQIILGSDVFLMPSVFEPCGITQMESFKSATPPLVRWTGGLVDTVIPHTEKNGTGFGFDGYTKR